MAWFFSLTLILSITGLVLLLVLKHYEMTSGRVVLGGLRPKVGRFFHRGLMFFERGIPRVATKVVTGTLRTVRSRTQSTLARAILFFELYLERTLHVVRQKSERPREGAASQFLLEVAAHKQKLLRRAPRNRMILED